MSFYLTYYFHVCSDLKSISEDELQQSFHDNFTQLKRMFEEYQEQEVSRLSYAFNGTQKFKRFFSSFESLIIVTGGRSDQGHRLRSCWHHFITAKQTDSNHVGYVVQGFCKQWRTWCEQCKYFLCCPLHLFTTLMYGSCSFPPQMFPLQHASYTDLFFMKIVPEWSLALFMDKFAMNRKDALERIQTQNRAQNIDDSQSLCITQDSLVEYV